VSLGGGTVAPIFVSAREYGWDPKRVSWSTKCPAMHPPVPGCVTVRYVR
jgi:hypothetical protein